jgi:hypothetical protein
MALRLRFLPLAIASLCLFAQGVAVATPVSKHEDARSNPCLNLTQSDTTPELTILGLVSPAVVSGAISVSTSGGPPDQAITYCLDEIPVWTSPRAPRALGASSGDGTNTYSVRNLSRDEHHLQAIAFHPDGHRMQSNVVSLRVVPDVNATFSPNLKAYALQPTAQQPLSVLLQHLATPGTSLTPEETDTRSHVAAMYLNFGFDPSLDYSNDLSDLLPTLLPTSWVTAPKQNMQLSLSMRFSADSPFYHAIPTDWPRVRLPHGYLKTIQLNTNQKGDGLGYGIAIASKASPDATINSMWYKQESTRKTVSFRVPSDWPSVMPRLEAGDRHVIFVDPQAGTFVSLYKTKVDPATGHPDALYASPLTSFNSLGDHGGSTASHFAELPLLIQPGEATKDDGPIRHALGGSVSRVWAARVYPATARDYGMLTSVNTCTGKGVTNTGLVPYGGIIQLDPALNLDQMKLSKPALRILQAIQTYGYYVMDFGCADLDIYTAISEEELFPYAGLYGFPKTGPGVEKEIARVLTTSDLYVIPPMTKRP